MFKSSPKHQLYKPRLEVHHNLLSCLYLALISNYLTLLYGEIEINPGSKYISKECFSVGHSSLNRIIAQIYTELLLSAAYNIFRNFGSSAFHRHFQTLKPRRMTLINMFCANQPLNYKIGVVCMFYKAIPP